MDLVLVAACSDTELVSDDAELVSLMQASTYMDLRLYEDDV